MRAQNKTKQRFSGAWNKNKVFSPIGSWIVCTLQKNRPKEVYQKLYYLFSFAKVTKVQSVLKTDQRADISAHSFFSAHEAKNATPHLYRHNCKLLTADLNQRGIIVMTTISLYKNMQDPSLHLILLGLMILRMFCRLKMMKNRSMILSPDNAHMFNNSTAHARFVFPTYSKGQEHKMMYITCVVLHMINCLIVCGLVEHCVSSTKGCGFISQGTHILTKKMYSWHALSHFG